jgi:Asp-tRNA(Asn)/Glu-tRNA(Gln) amidotransferase A subunit family amidase
MVPLAVGSQSNGSVVRPASFCGVVGFKPGHGLVPRSGVLRLSRTLDQIGVFGRTVEDVALIAECLAGFDEGDPDTRPSARPPLAEVATSAPPLAPRLAFVPTPVWPQADATTQAAFAELVEALGEHVERIDLPGAFDNALEWHRIILESDIAVSFAEEYERGRGQLSPRLREMIERGRRHLAWDYHRAVNAASVLNTALDEIFSSFDAIVTPAAPGVAPRGLESTGSPAFCSLWTLCGLPALSLPMLQDEAGLPIGVQLVGARSNDARLLRTANWLVGQDLGQGAHTGAG